ncbi:hypothetical protein CNMCM8812_006610 [Aspergillus fumigatus]|nr:hypothetical protein CNMCM8714_006701 [Aspergillus fumigatus]KAF4257842.1 hypothetical protein CNMCM8812_006610 [Aspergillus fumigatus]
MRHFDAWLLRDPYSIWHYYSTGRRWQEIVRDLIQERKICAPPVNLPSSTSFRPVDPYDRPINPQSASPLFGKLPAEIRLIIYHYVFGDEAVHLVQLKGKIRHSPTLLPDYPSSLASGSKDP